MLKRVLLGAGLAVVLLTVILFIVLKNVDQFDRAHAAEAVPSHALAYIDHLDYNYFVDEFFPEHQIWHELRNFQTFSKADSLLNLLFIKLHHLPAIQQHLDELKLSISVHLLGKKKLGFVYYLSLDEHQNISELEEEILFIAGEDALLNERKYEAVVLHDISLRQNSLIPSISYAIKDGLLMISPSSILLEDAIRALNSEGNIASEPLYRAVEATAGKYVPANVYLNLRNLNQLFYSLYSANTHHRLDFFRGLGVWGEFDLDPGDENIVLHGMSSTTDSVLSWLSIFQGMEAVKLGSPEIVPASAELLLSLGISDVQKFVQGLELQLRFADQFSNYQSAEASQKERYGFSVFSDMKELISDELVLFRMYDDERGLSTDLTAFKVKSSSITKSRIEAWLQGITKEGVSPEKLITHYRPDQQSSYPIYTFGNSLYKDTPLGFIFKEKFTMYDDYVIFSDSESALAKVIYHNILGKTLENDPSYKEMNSMISTKANMTVYVQPEAFIEQEHAYYDESVQNDILVLSDFFKKIPGLVIQFSSQEELLYSQVSWKYNSEIKEKAMTVWESMLDTVAIIKPKMVTNHYTSEKEIIVQDGHQNLYLINGTGRVLWNVKLDERIMSEVYQVDYYKNGKLQYLFNTESGIHLVDRNGNYVERYPVKFRSDATNGIALFDYDKSRDYRVFVACKDQRVYAYDLEGKTITGWDFKKTEGSVKNTIQHFRVGEKDYIVFSDGIRAYYLNRRGKERIKQKELQMVSRNSRFYLDMNIAQQEPRFVTTDTAGNVVAMSLEGVSELLMEHRAGRDHLFMMHDLNKDGKGEFLFVDGSRLVAYDMNGKEEFSFKIRNDIRKLPDVYEFSSNDLKLGITDWEKNEIYLLNSDGSLYEGFPLDGCTQFSVGYFVGSDSRFNLIVGSQDGFLYNYSIE